MQYVHAEVMLYYYRCQDYIEIDAKAGGVKEYCGGSLPSQPYIVGTGSYIIIVVI